MSPSNILVNSSNIKSISYDAQSRILQVLFKKNDRTYRYFDVPKHLIDQFLAAPSKGKFFILHIKDIYTYEEVVTSVGTSGTNDHTRTQVYILTLY